MIYSADEQLWYYFYSASGANQTKLLTCAQLVRTATLPDGPWSAEGKLVAFPTGAPPWTQVKKT